MEEENYEWVYEYYDCPNPLDIDIVIEKEESDQCEFEFMKNIPR